MLLIVTAAPARALINPNFTPADLVRGSTVILEFRLGAAAKSPVLPANSEMPKTIGGEGGNR